MTHGGAAGPAHGAPNEELKLSACPDTGSASGHVIGVVAGRARMGRSLTPGRYDPLGNVPLV
jgi:hypothetical protein